MKEYLKIFKSLSDETRLRIFNLLIEAEWLYVCEIVDSLEVPFYKISRHLKELENAGLLEQERKGKFIKYFLKDKESDFTKKLIESIKDIDNEILKNDRLKMIERLKKRGFCSLK